MIDQVCPSHRSINDPVAFNDPVGLDEPSGGIEYQPAAKQFVAVGHATR